jgi:hypothetical protein
MEGRKAVLKDLRDLSTRWSVDVAETIWRRHQPWVHAVFSDEHVFIGGQLDAKGPERFVMVALSDGVVTPVIGARAVPLKSSWWSRLFGRATAVEPRAFQVFALTRSGAQTLALGASSTLSTIGLPAGETLSTWPSVAATGKTIIAWTTDGSRLAAWTCNEPLDELHLRSADGVLDVQLQLVRSGDAISTIAWRPGGKSLLLGTMRGLIVELAVD